MALDQVLKYLARTNPSVDIDILGSVVGWQFFANPGVAFGIPVPQALVLVLTPIFLLALFVYYIVKPSRSYRQLLGGVAMITGALSNFVDRMLYGYTVDYMQVFTSVINLADVLIVAGAILILVQPKK